MDRVVTIEFLHEMYSYCPETGLVRHRVTRGKAKAGEEAGYLADNGYKVIKMSFQKKRVQIAAHIVAWVLHHGVWPTGDVDHWDTVRTNNTIANLRDATRSQNLANRNKKGDLPKGVTVDKGHKSRPFKAQLKIAKKNHYLGHFVCPLEAAEAYRVRAAEVFGEFART